MAISFFLTIDDKNHFAKSIIREDETIQSTYGTVYNGLDTISGLDDAFEENYLDSYSQTYVYDDAEEEQEDEPQPVQVNVYLSDIITVITGVLAAASAAVVLAGTRRKK